VEAPPDPRRTDETRRDSRAVHRLGDLAGCGHGSGAAPRGSDLAAVLHAQAAGIVAVDFLHVDTVLLRRRYVLVFIEHGTRRMHLGGVTANPTGEWTVQQARNLALTLGERFEDIKFLVRDRGSNFTASFDAVFQATGARILRTAVQAPRMNATCERLVGTCAERYWTGC
jgi:putative transposase